MLKTRGISLTRRVLGIGWLVLCGIAYVWSAIVHPTRRTAAASSKVKKSGGTVESAGEGSIMWLIEVTLPTEVRTAQAKRDKPTSLLVRRHRIVPTTAHACGIANS